MTISRAISLKLTTLIVGSLLAATAIIFAFGGGVASAHPGNGSCKAFGEALSEVAGPEWGEGVSELASSEPGAMAGAIAAIHEGFCEPQE